MKSDEPLIPPHGGYRKLKSFQIAQLVYDLTVRFCERYVDRFSRTRDQMVQAARSGVQNIAEGSQTSGTSKKTEIKLTSVERSSLEELKLDYEDYLRQRGLQLYSPNHPTLMRFKTKRCSSVDELRAWIEEERQRVEMSVSSVSVREGPCIPRHDELAANGILSLLNLACNLLDRQMAALDKNFLNDGGFTERLYRMRIQNRSKQ